MYSFFSRPCRPLFGYVFHIYIYIYIYVYIYRERERERFLLYDRLLELSAVECLPGEWKNSLSQ